MKSKNILLLLIIIVIILIIILDSQCHLESHLEPQLEPKLEPHLEPKLKHELEPKLESFELEPQYVLFHINPYDTSSFVKNMLTTYQTYKKENKTWEDSFQLSMIDTYKLYYNITTLPSSTQDFINKTINTIKNVVKNDNDDVYNWLVMSTQTFKPNSPNGYQFYSYENVNTFQKYYMNISVGTGSTSLPLKNVIDTCMSTNIYSIYLPKSIATSLNLLTSTNDIDSYKKAISAISISYTDIRIPVDYTYFDPIDIYINPSQYTFSGIGITDQKQPNYILLTDKSQSASLNRLLKNSSIDPKTPIHAWFNLPDFSINWNDNWIDNYVNTYNTSKTSGKSDMISTLDGINAILISQQISPIDSFPKDVNDLKNLTSKLPKLFYWVITLFAVYPSISEKENLIYYMKRPGTNVKECTETCGDTCISNYDQYFRECVGMCGGGSPLEITQCDFKCSLTSQYDKNYYCRSGKPGFYENISTYDGNILPSMDSCIKTNCK